MTAPVIINNRVQVRISFDTTGSMSQALPQVRRVSKDFFARLGRDIPGIEMGITAHGDYCDAGSTYITKHSPMTDDAESLIRFVDRVGSTGGGDSDECYELVLQESQGLGWKPGYQHVLIMIGDANPHPVGYSYGGKTYRIDWREEARKLADMGVKIYTVQALSYGSTRGFWSELARIGGGHHVQLDQFAYITDMLLAICYQQQGPEALGRFEEELSKAGRLGRNMTTAIGTLGGKSTVEIAARTTKSFGDVTALKSCDPSRFQVLPIDAPKGDKVRIDDFVTNMGIPYIRGRGFYEFMKSEEVQDHKEVILQDRASGDLFEGEVARDLLGLPKKGTVTINPKNVKLDKYKIFIQSTSGNRNLIGGTEFLYELDKTR